MRGRFRKTKRVLFHLAVRGLQTLARGLPRPVALAVLARVADIVYLVDRPAVRRSLAHLEIAFGPPRSRRERISLVRGMFRATGRNLVDVLRAFPRDRGAVDRLVRFEGLEHLERHLKEGRGVVALSAHLGNWEVLGAALVARGVPVHVVAQRVFDPRSDRLLNEWRAAAGLRVHPRGCDLFTVVRALREGHVVGMLVDQDTPGSSIFADFFGRLARTPRAPFVLARRTGAALVPMWIRLERDGRHVAEIRPALPAPASRDPEIALAADVAAWHRLLEEAIRSCPEQWVWHHRRWRSRPRADLIDMRQFAPGVAYSASCGAPTEVVTAR